MLEGPSPFVVKQAMIDFERLIFSPKKDPPKSGEFSQNKQAKMGTSAQEFLR
jgi:hypothetical protein